MRSKEQRKSGMTPLEIKFLVYEKCGSITAAARAIHCSRSQLSYCISRRRISPEIRRRLAALLDMTVEELFGEPAGDEEPEPESDSTEFPGRGDEDE